MSACLCRRYANLRVVCSELFFSCGRLTHPSLQHSRLHQCVQRLTSKRERPRTNTSCAGCHGLDGRGSDKAANISGSAKVQHLSDAQLSSIISNGVPGTGMPGFRNLNDKQTRAVVSYLRSLQGKLEGRNLPGDTGRGKANIFRQRRMFKLSYDFRSRRVPWT